MYFSTTGEISKNIGYAINDAILSFTINTPDINVKIKDYKKLNDRVVIVTFSDSTTEKAICAPEDKFDLERAIEVCVCKKIFGGTKAYNNAIKNALKQIAAIDKKKKADAEEEERIAKKKAKDVQRKIRRKEKLRQEQVNIQAEAFLKAMQMHENNNKQ